MNYRQSETTSTSGKKAAYKGLQTGLNIMAFSERKTQDIFFKKVDETNQKITQLSDSWLQE